LEAYGMSAIMTKEQAYREAAKVAIAFKMLQSGAVSVMSEEDAEKFLKWLD
jgi:hypothetical protein